MADDIVTRLRDVTEMNWNGDEVTEPLCGEAADEIERLTEWRKNALLALDKREADIERLRAAGDALHAAIRNHDLTEAHMKAWEEARRG